MSTLTPPATVAQFESFFSRDFIYGVGLETVRPIDIQNALNMASSIYNPRLFSTTPIGVPPNLTSEALIAYLQCSAHFLVTAIQGVGGLNKKGGGTNSQGEGIVSSKNVGGVSVSFTWPQFITNSPALFQFTKTIYGQNYLQMLIPRLVGNVGVVAGETTGFQGNFNSTTGFVWPF